MQKKCGLGFWLIRQAFQFNVEAVLSHRLVLRKIERLIEMKNFISVACAVLAFPNVMADTEPKMMRDIAYVDAQYYGDETGGFNDPYNTIQEAIDNVASNGTVVVAPGIYHESLMLTNFPIRLIASGCATNTTITSADWSWSNANASRIFISPSASGSSFYLYH